MKIVQCKSECILGSYFSFVFYEINTLLKKLQQPPEIVALQLISSNIEDCSKTQANNLPKTVKAMTSMPAALPYIFLKVQSVKIIITNF